MLAEQPHSHVATFCTSMRPPAAGAPAKVNRRCSSDPPKVVTATATTLADTGASHPRNTA